MRKYASNKLLDHRDRVNRAIDLIRRNLEQPLKLEVVARTACFSPFHFHRIFQSLIGESPNEFVKRLRLERALTLIWQKNWASRSQSSLTDIAFACGFHSSSDFSRCFRQSFGVMPSRFDIAAFLLQRRKVWQSALQSPNHSPFLNRLHGEKNLDRFAVRLRHLSPRSVAYVRVHDPLREGASLSAATHIVQWAERHGLSDGQWLCYMWDKADITAHEKWCYDVGLVVPEKTPRGEVSRIEFPAMEVAEIEIRGGVELEVRALDWLYGTWLPSSGFVLSDQPTFEAWIGRPFADGTRHVEYLNQLPIVRARSGCR